MSDEASAPGDAGGAPEHDDQLTFLCVVDRTEEMSRAVRFACLRARNANRRVALLYVTEPAEFQHWMAVGERMREEAREEAEEMVQAVASVVQRLTGKIPPIYIREGKVAEELINLVDEEQSIALLVLGAATGTDGPGPLIELLVEKQAGRLRVPVTIVPGNLTDQQLDAIC
ncbi:MAG TPA: universal stress protein [Rhodospirillaceae bacterium]|nr:universal stress protein [Rhodospirillaceae bacterium]